MTTPAPTPQAALVEALDALELAQMNGKAGLTRGELGEIAEAITKVRAALAQAEAAQPVEPVAYLARSRYGSQCHFGMRAAAEAWAGHGGEVFEIPLRHLGLVSPSLATAAPQPAEAAPTGPLDDFSRPIVYDTEAVDNVTHALTGDEGEDDSVTVLKGLARYVEHVWPGKTAQQVLIEYEEKLIAEAAPKQEAVHGLPLRVWGRPSIYPECDPELTLDPDQAMEWAHHGHSVGAYKPDGWGPEFSQPKQPAPEPVAGGWISVEDRLPEPDSGEVLVRLSGGMYALDEWHTHREDPTGMGSLHTLDMGCMWRTFDFEEITHWMPLPAAPQTPAPGDTEGRA